MNNNLQFIQLPALTLLAVWFVASALYRAWRKQSAARSETTELTHVFSWSETVFQLVGGGCALIAIWWGGRLFAVGTTLLAAKAVGASLLLSTVIDAAASWLWERSADGGEGGQSKVAGLSGALAGAVMLGAVAYVCGAPGGAIDVQAPVRGEWRIVDGGRTQLTNRHHNNPVAQNLALDMVLAEGPAGWNVGKPVFAPVSGTAVRVVNDWRPADGKTGEGNVVVIEMAEGVQVRMAHLMGGASTLVKEGDAVSAGAEIAKTGASGNVAPHFHIHAQREGRPVPMRIGPQRLFLIRNDILRVPQ